MVQRIKMVRKIQKVKINRRIYKWSSVPSRSSRPSWPTQLPHS